MRRVVREKENASPTSNLFCWIGGEGLAKHIYIYKKSAPPGVARGSPWLPIARRDLISRRVAV